MSENQDSQVQKLKKLAKMTGIDIEAALAEVQEKTVQMAIDKISPLIKQPAPVNVDMDELTAKVVEALKPVINSHIETTVANSELRIAGKIAEVIEELQKKIDVIKITSKPEDAQSIIQGVAATLQPVIVQESQRTVEAIFQANFKAMQSEIQRLMDEKLKSHQSQDADLTVQSQVGGVGLGSLFQVLMNPEILNAIKGVVEVFKPAPAAAPAAFMADFGRMMSFHDLMTKIEKRTATSDDITRGLSNIASPSPSIPQAQQGQTG